MYLELKESLCMFCRLMTTDLILANGDCVIPTTAVGEKELDEITENMETKTATNERNCLRKSLKKIIFQRLYLTYSILFASQQSRTKQQNTIRTKWRINDNVSNIPSAKASG